VRLEDGREVVVKAHRPEVGAAHLRAVQAVQRHLAAAGFPAPAPLAGPAPLGRGIAVVESLVADGDPVDAHDPALRRLLAGSLATLVRLCEPLSVPGLRGGFAGGGTPGLWLIPHDRRFDFEGTSAGAEWIDALGAEARRRRDAGAGRAVVGHGDWRAEHVRIAGGELTAVYDWDSLGIEKEPVFAGSAAHAFTADWSREPPASLPSLEESLAFIAEYEDARGGPFTAGERDTAIAALVYTLAYSARCVHSDVLTDMGRRPVRPAPPLVGAADFRGLLARHGARLLGIADVGAPAHLDDAAG
jgi:hypothetical protein